MIATLEHSLQNLPELDFPSGLHATIVMRSILLRLKVTYLTLVSLLGVSLALNIWHFASRVSELGGVDMLHDIVSIATVDYTVLIDMAGFGNSFFPTWSFLLLMVNIGIVGYVLYGFANFKKMYLLRNLR